MIKIISGIMLAFATLMPLHAFAESAALPVESGMGPNPILPKPETSLIPTVNIAPATGWPEGVKPLAATGFTVEAYASDFIHPRWIYVLPNGDVLVAETDSPKKPNKGGIKDWVTRKVMNRAGSGEGSADRITLLRDTDNDGAPDIRTPFLEGLYSPLGMTLVGNDFYVANTDAVIRFPYKTGDTKITVAGIKLADLPAGHPNQHWTRNLVASRDGRHLYASVDSNSNIAEHGMKSEINRAAILEIERESGKTRVFASGLRNPVGMDWQPESGVLWTAVNERDNLGSDLVPDYMTSVKNGGFYGWPYSYFGQHVDTRVEPQRPDLVEKAIVPDYALGAHTASLGLAFYTGDLFPDRYKNGAFIGQHGSWNRQPRSGYKVIFIPFTGGQPSGKAEDILTGFVSDDGKAMGRPVGVAVDKMGALLVADDVGDIVWRVAPAQPATGE